MPNSTSRDALLLLCRFCLSFLFLWGGTVKLMNPPAFVAMLAHEGVPASTWFGYFGIFAEVGGGLALLVGWHTRLLTLLFVVYLIVATLIGHRFWEFTGPAYVANRVNFTKNVAAVGGMLLLWITGPGGWSWDGIVRKLKD